MPRWLRYFLSGLATLIILLACAGAIYEQIGRFHDRRVAMPGALVDVGGYRMHIVCEGQGSPTVILDSGLGDNWLSWSKVQPAVAQFTRVCAYDRAGMGFSDPGPKARSSRPIAEELHTLLGRAGIAPPYILVGHSWGGLNVRMYASLYRADVVGMLLVDSSHPDQTRRLPAQVMQAQQRAVRVLTLVPYVLPFGIVRYSGACGEDALTRAAGCTAHGFREAGADMAAFDESGAQVDTTASLGDLPLMVLSHEPGRMTVGVPANVAAQADLVWSQMQEELRRLSSRGTRQVVTGASHYIQRDRPDAVIESIHQLWETAR
jgi:pimeloyl-ACP methyl ester carboxylesterase